MVERYKPQHKISLQLHHLLIGEGVINENYGRPDNAAKAYVRKQGELYTHSPEELKKFTRVITLAFRAIAGEYAAPIEDGKPDIICAACWRDDGMCLITPEEREAFKLEISREKEL